jgi:hypothetical protein
MKYILSGVWLVASSLAIAAQTSPATAPAQEPHRDQWLEHFKAQCPAKVAKLLDLAMPAMPVDPLRLSHICACAQNRLDTVPGKVAADSLAELAAADVLACSQPTISKHNQAWVAKYYGPYLRSQGWSGDQVGIFSHCIADQHWKLVFELGLQGRNSHVDMPAIWKQCTSSAGHVDTPMPDKVSAAPAAAASQP